MININFLATKQSKKERQRASDRLLFRISSYVLGGAGALAIIMLGVSLFFNIRTKQFEDRIATYKNSVLAQENVELGYLIFVNKLNAISEIYQSRSDKQAAMNFFTERFQDKADIVGMSYQAEQGGLILELSNDNVFKLQDSMDLINSPQITDQYKSVEKSALRRQDDGSYRLTVKLELKPND